MRRQFLKALAAAALATLSGAAAAQADYPNKPIRMVVAWPPASGIDVVMRHIADALRVELGQPIIVENRAGAAGMLGSEVVANAPPDGYTLLFHSAALNMVAAMGTQMPYKVPDSFTPIVNVFWSPMVLVAHPSLDVKTPQDIVALAKQKKGDLFYATSGHGAPSHFVAELFRARTGIQATAVPMKGSPQAMLEQIAGRVAFHFAVSSTALPPIRDGKVKGIAVTSKQRLAVAPDLPTMDELGFRNFNASYWNGILGPKGLPQPIAERIATAVNRVLAQPEIQQKLAPTANELDGKSDPQRFAAMMREDYALWAEVVRVANIKPE